MMINLKSNTLFKRYSFPKIYQKREKSKADLLRLEETLPSMGKGSNYNKTEKKIVKLKKDINSYNMALTLAFIKSYLQENFKIGSTVVYNIDRGFSTATEVLTILEYNKYNVVVKKDGVKDQFSYSSFFEKIYADEIMEDVEDTNSYRVRRDMQEFIQDNIELEGKIQSRNTFIDDILGE